MKHQRPTVIMLDESVHQHGRCGDPTCPCYDDPEMEAASSLLIDGRPANDPPDLAQRPLHSVARAFRLLK